MGRDFTTPTTAPSRVRGSGPRKGERAPARSGQATIEVIEVIEVRADASRGMFPILRNAHLPFPIIPETGPRPII